MLGFICGIVWFNGIIILDIYVLVVEVIVSVRFVGKSLKKFYLVENLYVVLYLFWCFVDDVIILEFEMRCCCMVNWLNVLLINVSNC